MSRGKVSRCILSGIAAIAAYVAVIASTTCFPFLTYQPKAPKALIKSD